jgi:hypothetical protein
MDFEYQRLLLSAQFERLQQRINDESREIIAEQQNGTVFARMYGPAGKNEPYVAKIAAGLYPIQPWRVGFINPEVEVEKRRRIPDRDPRFWPFSGLPGLDGGFHVAYQGPFRVFVCMRFTVEYFYYHPDERWEPKVFDLSRVVIQLAEEVRKAEHFSKWVPLVKLAAQ